MIVHPHPAGIEPGQHARLAPSSAYRWLACAASVTLAENNGIAERPGGAAALAGSIVHHGLERALRGGPLTLSDTEVFEIVMDGGMAESRAQRILASALDAVRYLVHHHQIDEIWLEERLRPTIARDDLWGTCDILGYSPRRGRALLVDLKTGLWPVRAEGNDQGLVYALGAFDFLAARGLPPVRDIVFAILQPRLRTIPDTWIIDRATLRSFRAFLVERAAATDNPEATPVPGEWCRFCPSLASCPVVTVKG